MVKKLIGLVLLVGLSLGVFVLPAQAALNTNRTLEVEGTPLSLDKIYDLVVDVVNFLLSIGLVIGIAYIAYGAILWITSQGGKAVDEAKGTIKAALIGIAIILGFGIIVNTIDTIIFTQEL
ncbi:MAG: hypothetical protein AAB463_02795 [Patescibacteria group bacterium]